MYKKSQCIWGNYLIVADKISPGDKTSGRVGIRYTNGPTILSKSSKLEELILIKL